MRKEVALGLTLGAILLSELAFSRPVRKNVGQRVNWTCEEEGCGRSFAQGWAIEINHKKPVSEGGGDEESNAEALCLYSHYKFHKDRGDHAAARLIYDRIQKTMGGRTRWWMAQQEK